LRLHLQNPKKKKKKRRKNLLKYMGKKKVHPHLPLLKKKGDSE
jgi:hypothetical protein